LIKLRVNDRCDSVDNGGHDDRDGHEHDVRDDRGGRDSDAAHDGNNVDNDDRGGVRDQCEWRIRDDGSGAHIYGCSEQSDHIHIRAHMRDRDAGNDDHDGRDDRGGRGGGQMQLPQERRALKALKCITDDSFSQ